MAIHRHTLATHHLESLISSKGLVAVLLIVALTVCCALYSGVHRCLRPRTSNIPECVRLRLRGQSNLDDQYLPTTREEARVKALFVYPVKSCRGVELSVSEVTGIGLKYDRLFSFAQLLPTNASERSQSDSKRTHQWRCITQREFPRLALLETELWVPDPRLKLLELEKAIEQRDSNGSGYSKVGKPPEVAPECHEAISHQDDWHANGGCLIVRFPVENDSWSIFGTRSKVVTLKLPLAPNTRRLRHKACPFEELSIWKDCPLSINLTNEVDNESLRQLSRFLGIHNPLGIFRVDEHSLRDVTRSLPKDRVDNSSFKVGFGDAFPVHLLSLASARAIDDLLPTSTVAKGSLDIRRFRANIIVTGPPAYSEDEWMRIAIGQAGSLRGVTEPGIYHVACRTARCTLPNVHPDSGLKDRNEPHASLKRTRQVDEGAKPHPCLGLSMIPLFDRGVVGVGDRVEVLTTGVHIYEKMFS